MQRASVGSEKVTRPARAKGVAFKRSSDASAQPALPVAGRGPAWDFSRISVSSSLPHLGAGTGLTAPDRSYFEARLGVDLGAVRLHWGLPAAGAAASLGAQAFTHGKDVVFGAGARLSEAPDDRRLLAHELVHVAQAARNRGAASKLLSQPGDVAEREADRAAEDVLRGRSVAVRAAPAAIARQALPAAPAPPPLAWGSGWFPSQGGPIPGVTTPPSAPAPAPMWPPPPWLREAVFEPPEARTPAGAPLAFQAYIALSAAGQQRAFELSGANGNVAAAIRALGPAQAQAPPFLVPVQGLLRLIEGAATRTESGRTDAQMSATQATFLRAHPSAPHGGDWGGAAPGHTRWQGLTAAQKADWTRRGTAAIGLMVAHAARAAPQLALSAASFEFDCEALDQVSLGAFAAGGSRPRETVLVGFEFTAICEVNPAYALSTIEHELHGHPVFDAAGGNTAGRLYEAAAAQVPGSPSGEQTYEYYPSEIYSLLREIPLWAATAAADAGRSVTLPGGTKSIGDLNPDPRTLIGWHLRQMQRKWEASLLEPLLRGFWQRVSADPGIAPAALTAFKAVLARVLGASVAAQIAR